MNRLMRYDIDDVLALAGLRRQPSLLALALPALGLLVVGVAVGVGIGMVVAPSSGLHLRQAVSDRLNQIREHRKSSEPQSHAGANGM